MAWQSLVHGQMNLNILFDFISEASKHFQTILHYAFSGLRVKINDGDNRAKEQVMLASLVITYPLIDITQM